MELKNEERSSIFAAYWGAKIKHEHFDKTFTLYKIELRDLFSVDLLDEELVIYRSRLIDDCQLLLSPLSAISDEHAIEVAKIDYGYNENAEDVRTFMIMDGKAITSNWKTNMYIHSGKFITQVADFLRSKSYNVGYSKYSPADLVSMGIVIETKTENI